MWGDNIKILFVCTGNTCRSVMAEFIFNTLNENKNISSSSAGISVVHNSIASKCAVQILKSKYNIDILNKKAIQIQDHMIKEASLVLTMTYSIKCILSKRYEEYKHKVFTLKEYSGEVSNLDISDPYGRDVEAYSICHDEIASYIKILLKKFDL